MKINAKLYVCVFLTPIFRRFRIARPVISNMLGHADPNSLDYYLFADMIHLRECALSIADFPVSEEVFRV